MWRSGRPGVELQSGLPPEVPGQDNEGSGSLGERVMIDEGEGDASTDAVIDVNGVKLLVDPISARYLSGAEVDFVDNITGGGFTIKNPNAKSTCGCGSSFSV